MVNRGPFTFYLPSISPKSEETIKFAVYGDVDTGDNVTYNALKRLVIFSIDYILSENSKRRMQRR